MVAGLFQRPPSLKKCGCQLARPFDRRTINWLCDAGEFRIRWIQNDHTPVSENLRIESCEGCAQGFPNAVAIADELRRFSLAKQGHGLLDNGVDFISKVNSAD